MKQARVKKRSTGREDRERDAARGMRHPKFHSAQDGNQDAAPGAAGTYIHDSSSQGRRVAAQVLKREGSLPSMSGPAEASVFVNDRLTFLARVPQASKAGTVC